MNAQMKLFIYYCTKPTFEIIWMFGSMNLHNGGGGEQVIFDIYTSVE